VPCLRSCRRAAVNAASTAADHSSSVLVNPDLVRRQAEVAEHRPEWLAGIDGLEELLAHLHWQPALRSGSAEFSLCVAVCLAAECAAAPGVPACGCAVLRFGHRMDASGPLPLSVA
jgi:hypothetical protein